jgi:hypothetical protein
MMCSASNAAAVLEGEMDALKISDRAWYLM